ncbi:hypothetical protein A4A49_31982 [Nicotiana attenuata]|uniref:Uncharacterized protein n=1 Tax=Nicotiana attenuata TaxID=49451 RepID=A0A1J6ICU3_NICAT|nr:hypothetical protein A4A49_31982 [Nicotiana attenuata]
MCCKPLSSVLQRLFRAWKARLSSHYSRHIADGNILSHRPEDIELEDWKYLVEYSGSSEFKGQLQELVAQQQSEENEHPLPRDEILSAVLGERTSYVCGKGYGKKPPKKSHIQAANLEASVSSAMATVHQEMQAEMSRKLQEEREQMAAELKSNMEQELQRKLEEKLEHVNAEVDNRISVEVAKRIQEQLAAIMTGMQQVIYS